MGLLAIGESIFSAICVTELMFSAVSVFFLLADIFFPKSKVLGRQENKFFKILFKTFFYFSHFPALFCFAVGNEKWAEKKEIMEVFLFAEIIDCL